MDIKARAFLEECDSNGGEQNLGKLKECKMSQVYYKLELAESPFEGRPAR